MDLFLTEKTTDSNDKKDLKKVIENLAKVIKGSGGDPVEFFFGEGLKTVYSISEASSKIALEAALTKAKVTYKENADMPSSAKDLSQEELRRGVKK